MSSGASFARLRDFTPARVALGRAGAGLRTPDWLDFQLAHARARDAVHAEMDAQALAIELNSIAGECLICPSAAADRATYLRRPDLGRRLSDDSRGLLASKRASWDVALIIADGLSALAVERHAAHMLRAILRALDPLDWRAAPPVIVKQGRVAVGDDVAHHLGASLSVVFIGERPGLSSPDSLGIYLTWNPEPGRTDADRNCISNVRAEGLSYTAAAQILRLLMTESRARKISGVALKCDAPLLAH